MKLKKSILAALISATFVGSLPVFSAASTLSTDESNTLTYMKEEEKLARDVYRTLYDKWNIRAFSNISGAEQRHMDKLSSSLMLYNLPDPVTNDLTGLFTNPELAALYNTLTTKGQSSALAALNVGAYIEEIDILDLQKAINESSQQDLKKIYANLMRGSRNHLRAFVRQIENQGVTYKAQAMSQTEVDKIVNAQMERGGNRDGRRGNGGNGGGQQHGQGNN